MDDASEISYWCHLCSRSVTPVIDGEIINCNLCQSGFVEEMENAPDSVANDPQQAADSLWAPILLGMINTVNRGDTESNADDEDDAGDDEENDAETHLAAQLDEVLRRRTSHSAQILELLRGIRAGLVIESESNEENPDNELVVLINSFNQRVRIQDSVPSGSLGDYFIGPGFELLLHRLAETDPNRYGTPPATKEAVEALERVRIEEGLLQCTVCLDEFEVGVEAKEMPCKHRFHSDCLLPWLELHSSCPVCRYLLPTAEDDDETKTETDAEASVENDGVGVGSVEGNGSSLD